MSKQADKPLTLGERMLLEGNKKKQQKHEMVVEKLMTEEDEARAVREWHKLFANPEEAMRFEDIGKELAKAKLGKRKKETDAMYMMRLQYIVENNYPECYINDTYIYEGNVSEQVHLKRWMFNKFLEQTKQTAEMEVIYVSETELHKRARVIKPDGTPGPWVTSKWNLAKAKKLNLYHETKVQWTDNILSMLNARCDGQLYDVLGGFATGRGFLSKEEAEAK